MLVLTGAVPYPLTTGAKIRTYNLMKVLAAEFDIDLLTVITSNQEKSYIAALEAIGVTCHVLAHERLASSVGKGLDAMSAFIFSDPYLTRHYTFRAYRRELDRLCAEASYDVIHCDSISLAGNLEGCDRRRLILTQHNIEQIIWAGYVEHADGALTRTFYRNQYRKVKRLEEHLADIFGHIVTVSEEDKARIAESFPGEKIVVVENGVDPEAYRTDIPVHKRLGIVFTGSLDWHPNIDGLKFFAADIYPYLKETIAVNPVAVVGRRPTSGLREMLSTLPGVMLYSDVPAVQPYLKQARVMMVPLRIGGGSRLKILEAMASGLPVVATGKGAEGLAVADGRELLIRDDPKDFAQALIHLCKDEAAHAALAREGMALIQRKYSWQQVAQPLAELWRTIAHA